MAQILRLMQKKLRNLWNNKGETSYETLFNKEKIKFSSVIRITELFEIWIVRNVKARSLNARIVFLPIQLKN